MDWMQILLMLGMILVLTVVSLFIFNAIKKYILPKYNIKKMYLLILIFIFLAVPAVIPNLYSNLIIQLIQMLCVSVIFLTYMELKKIETEKKNRPIVGRPKAKQNRVKDNQNK